jgi:hypothetical protein
MNFSYLNFIYRAVFIGDFLVLDSNFSSLSDF